VTKLGQKVDKLPHPSPANSRQTRAACLQLHKDGNLELLICSTSVCKVSRQDGAAPEFKTYPYSIAPWLLQDGYIGHESLKGYDIDVAGQVVAFHESASSQ